MTRRTRYAILEGGKLLSIRDTQAEALAYVHAYERALILLENKLTLLEIIPITSNGGSNGHKEG